MGPIIRILIATLLSSFGAGCGEPTDVKGAETEVVAFAKRIAERDIRGAYGLLSEDYRKTLGFEAFEKKAKGFLSSEFGPIQRVYVQDSSEMGGWRTKETGDVGWAYVIVEGTEFADAIAGIVKREGDRLRIRKIQWGKP